jgi:hypothetical protein
MEKTRFYVGSKGKDSNHMTDFNAPQAQESFEEKAMRTEYWIAKQIGIDLVKTYPNRQWHVDVDSRNKVIVISCPSLSKREGYRLHMRRDCIAELLPRCRRAAGAILERFNVTRGRLIDPTTFEAFARDVRDDVICSDRKDTVEKWNASIPNG